MPRKEPVVVEYSEAPGKNYRHQWIAVGRINRDAEDEEKVGPQRDVPATNDAWEKALRLRYKLYGEFNPLLVSDRIISLREDGTLWPLDGNGSNHWYETQFGPDYKVPCRVITGLSVLQELRLFLALQENRKAVSRQNKYVNLAMFDTGSVAARLEKVVEACGFHVAPSPTDPLGVPSSAGAWVLETLGEERLRETLHAIKVLWPESLTARANGSTIKGLASALNKPAELDQDILFTALKEIDPRLLSQEARGNASERIVLARIEQLYKAATGQLQPEPLVPPQPDTTDEPEGDEAAVPAGVTMLGEPIAFVPVPSAVFQGPEAPAAPVEPSGASVPDPEAIAAQEAQAGPQAPPEDTDVPPAPRKRPSRGTSATSAGSGTRGRRESRSATGRKA